MEQSRNKTWVKMKNETGNEVENETRIKKLTNL